MILNIKLISFSTTNRIQFNREKNLFYARKCLKSYLMLDAVIANTSALISIIFQIFSLINAFIYYKKLNLDLIDPFFNFNEEIVIYNLKGEKLEN